MSKQKKTPIKYTSRDFDSIKSDIVEHAKRFYPEQWKDFTKGTINSLLVDSVAYVGDVLSYYLDYQANESFMDSAIEEKLQSGIISPLEAYMKAIDKKKFKSYLPDDLQELAHTAGGDLEG